MLPYKNTKTFKHLSRTELRHVFSHNLHIKLNGHGVSREPTDRHRQTEPRHQPGWQFSLEMGKR